LRAQPALEIVFCLTLNFNNTIYSIINNIDNEVFMDTITANELKTKGVSAIENKLAVDREVVITVRGKEKFVVMDMQHYNFLRECELEAALHEARADYQAGKFVSEEVEKHIKRLKR